MDIWGRFFKNQSCNFIKRVRKSLASQKNFFFIIFTNIAKLLWTLFTKLQLCFLKDRPQIFGLRMPGNLFLMGVRLFLIRTCRRTVSYTSFFFPVSNRHHLLCWKLFQFKSKFTEKRKVFKGRKILYLTLSLFLALILKLQPSGRLVCQLRVINHKTICQSRLQTGLTLGYKILN